MRIVTGVTLGCWPWSLTIANLKDFAEFVALLAAAGYFVYRWTVGYFIQNLSLRLECLRQPTVENGYDYVRVTVFLSKGERGSLDIHDAQAKAAWVGGELVESLVGIDRLSFKTELLNGKERKVIDFLQRSKENPLLRLTPGEATQFCAFFRVPSSAVCKVEVVVMGKNPKSDPVGQWRASTISLSGQ